MSKFTNNAKNMCMENLTEQRTNMSNYVSKCVTKYSAINKSENLARNILFEIDASFENTYLLFSRSAHSVGPDVMQSGFLC